jgi:ribonuclease D
MAEGMSFKVTVALRASRVEKWIRDVKRDFLDAAPTKCVGLDCEFTDPREGDQRAAVLQLSVATETLVFQICWADEVPQVLKEFLQDNTIRFCGAAISKDVEMLSL